MPAEETRKNHDSYVSEPTPVCALTPLEEATPAVQLVVSGSGLAVSIVVGLLLIMVPILFVAPALVAVPAHKSTVHPCAVPGLTLADQPTSWASQAALMRDTAIEFTIRLVTFESLAEWGGPFSFLVTAGAVGQVSGSAWFSAVGVVVLWIGILQLTPVDSGGGRMLWAALIRCMSGGRSFQTLSCILVVTLLLVSLVLVVRMYWIDFRWLWNTFAP